MDPSKNNNNTNTGIFGSTTAPGSTGSLFGSATTAGSSNPFGIANPTGGSIFGSGQTGATSLFGNPSSSTDKPPTSSGGLFGGVSSNLFGSSSATTSSTTPQGSPAKPGGLFGNTSAAPASTTSGSSPSIFGANTNTGSTPSIFGANSGSSTYFGAGATTAHKDTAAPTSLFGAATSTSTDKTNSLFAPPKPAGPSSSTTTATAPSLFGAVTTPSTDKGASTSLFGASKPILTSSSTATTPSLFGATTGATSDKSASSNLFSAPKPAGASPSTAAPSIFGAPPSSSTPSGSSVPTTSSPLATATSNKPNEPAPKPSLFAGTGQFKSTAPAKSSPLAMGSLVPTEKPASAAESPKPVATATTSATTPHKASTNLAPSLLRGKTLEDLVARWNTELDDRVEDFKHTADEIAAWDQALIHNGDKICLLYDELQRIDPMQSSIDQTLDYVESQQAELSTALEEYERQLSNQVQQDYTTPGRLRTAAQEREEGYKTAEEVHGQLDEMASSLSTMIAELNTIAGPKNDDDGSTTEDPIVQISGILNAHLSSLNWISEISQELGSKIVELESRVNATKLEFGLVDHQSNTKDENSGNHRVLPHHLLPPRR